MRVFLANPAHGQGANFCDEILHRMGRQVIHHRAMIDNHTHIARRFFHKRVELVDSVAGLDFETLFLRYPQRCLKAGSTREANT